MNKRFLLSALAVGSVWVGVTGLAQAAEPATSSAELLRRVDQQQQQIDALKKQVEVANSAKVEEAGSTDSGPRDANSTDTWVGGYGELHHSNYQQKPADFDLHRFVLFFGHKFDDKLRFFSELEVEHSIAGEGKKGEVELEQAYIEYQVHADFNWKTGLFLIPVGIINETHEPPTFYGVERNSVEKDIVPATWWEGGAGATWNFADGFVVDIAATSGLNVAADFNIRKGRQKVSEAVGEDLAYTTRITYSGMAGLQLAASMQYQQDITQGLLPEGAPATLVEVHGIYQIGGFELRALYASWDIDSTAAELLGRDRQTGWYVEPSWQFSDSVGVFIRQSLWDTEAGSRVDSERESLQMGVNYWLHPQVVLKADYERQDGNKNDAGADFDDKGINVGLGYQF